MPATDRALLLEYAADGSGEAFAELVRRHSGSVYAACLRILGNPQAAEDAVQAVFMVLARKAGHLGRESCLAGWLLLTARHVALRSLRAEARRKAREKEAATMGSANERGPAWEDVRPHLDAALAALPAAQRSAVVLRFLEGRTREEAAREMGCSEESLSVTASRALVRLRGWLGKRGVGVSSDALCVMLTAQAGAATVPAALLATLQAIGTGAAASSAASALAEGTLRTLLAAKLKAAAWVAGTVLALGAGGSLVVPWFAARQPLAASTARGTDAEANRPFAGLPSWVPAPGEVAVLTQANGRLANSFASTCAPYFHPFYYAKIVSNNSSYLVNPYFGEYGALVGCGGGPSSSNDNTLWGLVLGRETCTFRRLIDPTPLFGSGTDAQTRENNSIANTMALQNTVFGEYTVDRKPCARPSFGALDVIGPEHGGAPCGTFVRVLSGALSAQGNLELGACHQVDFENTTGPHNWKRRSNQTLAASQSLAPAQWTAYVPSQQRIYIECRAAASWYPPRWYDLAGDTYAIGTGRPREIGGQSTDTGILFHVPERNLVLFADCGRGKTLRLQYLKVSVAQPDWTTTVALSQALPVPVDFSCACWCPENQRIIAGNITGENAAVYEIEIPADLGNAWPVTRAPFGAGQTIGFSGSPAYKKWTYNPKTRSILYMPYVAQRGGDETIWVYRPRNQ